MANSCRLGPLNLPFGMCRILSRTPGTLGIFDQGDPNVTSLLGDTPGPLGFRDWADPTVHFFPNDGLAGMCAIGRSPGGAPLSLGGSSSQEPAPKLEAIALDKAQEMALMITTVFEGGKSMNYQALADDFDGQGTSFGLIQWNFGKNTLGPLLKKMLAADAEAFAGCFPEDAEYAKFKTALDANNKGDQLKWVRALLKDKRTVWSNTFTAIGTNTSFNRIQREEACAKYHPPVVAAIEHLREISPSLTGTIEFRSYAALFDLCVQQGGIDNVIETIRSRVKDENPSTQLELIKIAVVERAEKANDKWVSDCISRRMGILTGSAYESKENEVTKKRANLQFSLISENGTKVVSGL